MQLRPSAQEAMTGNLRQKGNLDTPSCAQITTLSRSRWGNGHPFQTVANTKTAPGDCSLRIGKTY